jgi:hypothetical protein
LRESKLTTPIETEFAATFDLAKPVYVLIDPMLGEPVPLDELESPGAPTDLQAAREKSWSRNIYRIALNQDIELPAHLHPYLVQMREDDPWLQDTLSIAHQERMASQARGLAGTGQSVHRIGGWLQSSLPVDALVNRLSRLLTLEPMLNVNAQYLRLADRRVLAWVRHVVGDVRLQQSLSFVDRWVYLDTCGQVAELIGIDLKLRPRLWFIDRQWALLLRGAQHHSAAARWLGELDNSCDRQDSEIADAQAMWPAITEALDCAKHARQRAPEHFVGADDLIAWAVLVLLHPNLKQSEHQQALLDTWVTPIEPTHQRFVAAHARLLKGINHEHS